MMVGIQHCKSRPTHLQQGEPVKTLSIGASRSSLLVWTIPQECIY
jgi:hypothetical protein